MHAHDFAEALAKLLADAGGSVSEPKVRRNTKECRDEIYQDTITHGGRIEDPFFNLIISKGTAVFTFFEDPFTVYVFQCEEIKLISETERFAMSETDECKAYLARVCGKTHPDLAVPRHIAEFWMELG